MSAAFLKLPEVMRKTGLARSTVFALSKIGRFPRQVRIGGSRSTAWVAAEIEAWMAASIANRDAERE